MHGLTMSMGALALGGLATARNLQQRWTYPDCELDNCYRNMIDEKCAEKAPEICMAWLASTTTEASAIPTDFANCGSDIKAVSSACSCIAYTYTHTKPAATTPVVSTTPVETPTSSNVDVATTTPCETSEAIVTSEAASTPTKEASSSSEVGLTTSTIYSANVYTVTSCAPTVTDCPASPEKPSMVTEIIAVKTTVCPVEEEQKPTPAPMASTETWATTAVAMNPEPTTVPTPSTVWGTGMAPSKTTIAGNKAVTAAAGRVERGFEMAAGVVGALAVALL